MPTFIDLFAGCGGFSEGLKQAGLEHVVGVEMDETFARSYALNHEHVIVADVRDVTPSDIESRLAGRSLDVLAASPPCQSFSSCGPRTANDPKDALYREVVRIAAALRPRVVLIENVTGLLTKRTIDGRRFVDCVEADLRDAGYRVDHRVLCAVDFGVPQKRRRVIIVGVRHDVVSDASFFPEPLATLAPEDVAVSRVLLPRDQVPLKYYAPPRRRAYFDRKPEFVRFVKPDKPCLTVRACYHKNRGADALVKYAEDDAIRMLTERECAAIQSFPEDYKFAGCMTKVYQQVGNAIPVALARAVGEAVVGAASSAREQSSS